MRLRLQTGRYRAASRYFILQEWCLYRENEPGHKKLLKSVIIARAE